MPGHERPSGPGQAVTPPDEEVVQLLERGEVEVLGLLPRASNYTFLAKVTKDGQEALAVYKPRAGEAPLWDFPHGTLCRREVAAYVFARALGWPRVPPTILRDGPEGPGSFQLFMRFDPDEHYFTLAERMPDEFRRIALFDAVVNNADRKSGHCLLGADGTIFVVDHGVCFSVTPKLRTVIWDFAGEEVPAPLLGDLRGMASELAAPSLRGELTGLLSPAEVEAVDHRLDRLIETGRFPEPGPGRPYPWPPV